MFKVVSVTNIAARLMLKGVRVIYFPLLGVKEAPGFFRPVTDPCDHLTNGGSQLRCTVKNVV